MSQSHLLLSPRATPLAPSFIVINLYTLLGHHVLRHDVPSLQYLPASQHHPIVASMATPWASTGPIDVETGPESVLNLGKGVSLVFWDQSLIVKGVSLPSSPTSVYSAILLTACARPQTEPRQSATATRAAASPVAAAPTSSPSHTTTSCGPRSPRPPATLPLPLSQSTTPCPRPRSMSARTSSPTRLAMSLPATPRNG